MDFPKFVESYFGGMDFTYISNGSMIGIACEGEGEAIECEENLLGLAIAYGAMKALAAYHPSLLLWYDAQDFSECAGGLNGEIPDDICVDMIRDAHGQEKLDELIEEANIEQEKRNKWVMEKFA